MKKALITGITGQDGSYLTELLLSKNYEVHGIIRRVSDQNMSRIKHLNQVSSGGGPKLQLHYGDLADANSLRRAIFDVYPDEVYNLAAQSDVRISFDVSEYTADITGLGVLRLLEVIKDFQGRTGKRIKIYQASSSEMFGAAPPPQNEKTPFHPRSPYASAKVFAYYMTMNYREAYDFFVVNGILFNHESPRRGENFATRKITRGIARILVGLDKKIYLGNLEARRDWGYAPEYMEAAWLMMQQPEPDDYVIGTGETHSVKQFLEAAFKHAGISNWQDYVEIDPRYYRPTEVTSLVADISKAKKKLGWQPRTKFGDLVKIMMDAELMAHGIKIPA